MTPHYNNYVSTLTLLILACTLSAPSMQAQEDSKLLHERPVLVWNDGDEHIIRIEAGSIRRGFLGVNLLDLTPELRTHFSVPTDRGIMISRVLDGSPAERAGLQPADILTELNGEAIPATLHLSLLVARHGKGDTIELDYWRDGRQSTASVTLETHERSQFDIAPLINRRIMIKTSKDLKLQSSDVQELDIDHEWVESVVGAIGARFSESNFLLQLEAMRTEREDLYGKLEQLEDRLQELEAELQRLEEESD
jgi:hypothetical protein